MTVFCPRCGKNNDSRFRFCLGCGGPLPHGAEVAAGAEKRPSQAGTTAPSQPGDASPAARKTAAAGEPVAATLPAVAPGPDPQSEAPTAKALQGTVDLPSSRIQPEGIPGAAAPRAAPAPAESGAVVSVPLRGAGRPPSGFIDDDGTRLCRQCGHRVPRIDVFCGNCGGRLPEARSTGEPISERRPAGYLGVINDEGVESARVPISEGRSLVGRGVDCDVHFEDDALLAQRHFELDVAGRDIVVKPIDRLNGLFLRISAPVEIATGDVFRIGQELLRFERFTEAPLEIRVDPDGTVPVGSPVPPGAWGRVCQVASARLASNAWVLGQRDVFLGRERGSILFPRDGYVSGSHAVISDRGTQTFLKDLGSSNGTFLRIKGEVGLKEGDLLLAGRHLLRIHLGTS